MKVRLRVQSIETREFGEGIVVDDVPEYYAALAKGKAQIPAGFVLNAIMVDR
jgi:hypothetical protein